MIDLFPFLIWLDDWWRQRNIVGGVEWARWCTIPMIWVCRCVGPFEHCNSCSCCRLYRSGSPSTRYRHSRWHPCFVFFFVFFNVYTAKWPLFIAWLIIWLFDRIALFQWLVLFQLFPGQFWHRVSWFFLSLMCFVVPFVWFLDRPPISGETSCTNASLPVHLESTSINQ